MTIWVCGNSHTIALKQGYEDIKISKPEIKIFALGGANFDNSDFCEIDDGAVRFTNKTFDKFLKRFTGLSRISESKDIWGFCIGSYFSRIYNNAFWRSATPSEIAGVDKRPISKAVLLALIERDQQFVMKFFSALNSIGVQFFVIGGPPPSEKHAAILKGTPLETVAYIEKQARRWFKEQMSILDVEYVDVPEVAYTKKGLLKDQYKLEFRNDGKIDPHHANREYGALMIEKIAETIQKLDTRN